MLQELSKAIVEAFKSHPTSVVSGVLGIMGTVTGAVVAFILNRIKEHGRITCYPVAMQLTFSVARTTDGYNVMPIQADGADCEFHLRIVNTYPVAQTVDVVAIHFCQRKTFRPWTKVLWMTSGRTQVVVGVADDKDVLSYMPLTIPARSFIRVTIRVHGRLTHNRSAAQLDAALNDVHLVQFEFLASPKRKVHYRYKVLRADVILPELLSVER